MVEVKKNLNIQPNLYQLLQDLLYWTVGYFTQKHVATSITSKAERSSHKVGMHGCTRRSLVHTSDSKSGYIGQPCNKTKALLNNNLTEKNKYSDKSVAKQVFKNELIPHIYSANDNLETNDVSYIPTEPSAGAEDCCMVNHLPTSITSNAEWLQHKMGLQQCIIWSLAHTSNSKPEYRGQPYNKTKALLNNNLTEKSEYSDTSVAEQIFKHELIPHIYSADDNLKINDVSYIPTEPSAVAEDCCIVNHVATSMNSNAEWLQHKTGPQGCIIWSLVHPSISKSGFRGQPYNKTKALLNNNFTEKSTYYDTSVAEQIFENKLILHIYSADDNLETNDVNCIPIEPAAVAVEPVNRGLIQVTASMGGSQTQVHIINDVSYIPTGHSAVTEDCCMVNHVATSMTSNAEWLQHKMWPQGCIIWSLVHTSNNKSVYEGQPYNKSKAPINNNITEKCKYSDTSVAVQIIEAVCRFKNEFTQLFIMVTKKYYLPSLHSKSSYKDQSYITNNAIQNNNLTQRSQYYNTSKAAQVMNAVSCFKNELAQLVMMVTDKYYLPSLGSKSSYRDQSYIKNKAILNNNLTQRSRYSNTSNAVQVVKVVSCFENILVKLFMMVTKKYHLLSFDQVRIIN